MVGFWVDECGLIEHWKGNPDFFIYYRDSFGEIIILGKSMTVTIFLHQWSMTIAMGLLIQIIDLSTWIIYVWFFYACTN